MFLFKKCSNTSDISDAYTWFIDFCLMDCGLIFIRFYIIFMRYFSSIFISMALGCRTSFSLKKVGDDYEKIFNLHIGMDRNENGTSIYKYLTFRNVQFRFGEVFNIHINIFNIDIIILECFIAIS